MIRLDIEGNAVSPSEARAHEWSGRERKLSIALTLLLSLNVMMISGAITFWFLAFGN